MNREALLLQAIKRMLEAFDIQGKTGYELTTGRKEPGPLAVNARAWAPRVSGTMRLGQDQEGAAAVPLETAGELEGTTGLADYE